MIFERSISGDLVRWQARVDRKPLLVMGARQVGKTTAIRSFGELHFEDVAYFNLEKSPELHEFFATTKDPVRILENLSLYRGKVIKPGESLVVFDEIQACPNALTSLKYFAEDASSFAIIGAGSLLGITVAEQHSFPVGKVQFLDMQPLTFTEYLQSTDERLYSAFLQFLEGSINQIPAAFFNPLTEAFNQFIITGGMPEAAQKYVITKDLNEMMEIQDGILRSYYLDFAKHAGGATSSRIQYVWDSIPSQLAKENKKFMYKAVRSGARAREYEAAITWLERAGLVHKIFHAGKPVSPLSAYRDLQFFKLYLLDVGLLIRLAEVDPSAIVFAGDHKFRGALFENYIAQVIMFITRSAPHYWTSSGTAEVDFLMEMAGSVLPIEVKSGRSLKSKSLAVYREKYEPKLRIRFSFDNLTLDDDLLNIPFFLADHVLDLSRKAMES